ncbi:hypothetical protein OEZ86_007083 [Tetradesmus obliquus]|nr:hypothetical protein OEZ86_007083 [Tetradesmus obliquus]
MLPEAHWAFVRTDRYGEGGWAPQPLWERARLAVLAFTLLPLRLFLALGCVAAYYLIVRISTIIPNEIIVRRIVTVFGKLWSRACLFCLGFVHIKWVRVGGSNEPRSTKRRSVAVVSNHMSWADILIQMARYFPAFVARDGTQNLPMIGLISRRMQCIYVDREKKAPAAAAAGTAVGAGSAAANGDSSSSSCGRPLTPDRAAAVAAAGGDAAGAPAADVGGVSGAVKRRMLLTQQHPEQELRPMLLFPEGTTSNGRYLLPFKTGAFLAGVPVLPTIIHYHTSSSSSDDTHCSTTARITAAAAVAAAATAAAGLAAFCGAGAGTATAAGLAAAGVAAVLGGSALMGVGGVSPTWESIDATRHLLLMMCQPFHTVTCYELPLYTPSPAEQADPRLYAANSAGLRAPGAVTNQRRFGSSSYAAAPARTHSSSVSSSRRSTMQHQAAAAAADAPAAFADLTPAGHVQQLLGLAFPPVQPLIGSEDGSFAQETITTRLPAIMDTVLADLKAEGASSHPQQQALQQQLAAAAAGVRQMQAEMPVDGALQPLQMGAHFSEEAKARFYQLLQHSLWGNKTDLSMLVDVAHMDSSAAAAAAAVGSGSSSSNIIVNETDELWDYLKAQAAAAAAAAGQGAAGSEGLQSALPRIDIILDNAGLELFTDLVLADYLVATGLAGTVVLHGKALPWFVSDTLSHDLHHIIEAVSSSSSSSSDSSSEANAAALAAAGKRWAGHLEAGRWRYAADKFWTTPHPFWWMQELAPELHAELAGSSLLVFKGDLNYRKLANDCRWPPTTPFATALGGFCPSGLLSLRTLKADVIAGLAPGEAEALDKLDARWQVNGKFGVLQFAQPGSQ